ncbi:cytochrome bd biosynthesis protein [Mergibacter septicus]|uniref:Cytochrome bd biosynthesis protein n=1 Tax=Mergibacter septicus TaxID=221402 RepID=A0A8D4IX92_9PAST|nr:cyd operon YbgE family protein [Mergibacter septicus]AWX15056.1 cytochrome bd biosynthesis protein [Mergibacter septicus]QDJ14309.1 cytochrome bd biosynthesis protein [Mergibacter septicus]UTU48250.1 cytochrome bd biosynthesis protein [Mergibacter septicus]WMR96132.1 cyd operon YbgE family protein [Mergibacter septicus]
MIDFLYQLVNKGSFRALSFILALGLTISIFTHTKLFALNFGGISPLITLTIFWSVVSLWIHGMGLDLHKKLWKLVFMPVFAYLIASSALIYIYFI